MNRTPVLKGFISHYSEGDLIRVWCPYCNKFHTHGWPADSGTAKQHRVAHCVGDTPFKDTGYYIKPFAKTEIDSSDRGRCKKCGATRDFGKELRDARKRK